MKIFDNPQNLSELVIYWRLFALDPNVVVEMYEPGVLMVKLICNATDEQINAKLTALNDAGDTIAARLTAAREAAGAIPSWATWAQTDWTTYYTANISATQINAIATLADAKAMLNKMSGIINNIVKLEIALRNKVFPDL